MLHYIKIYFIILLSYLAMDAIWFYRIASSVYKAEIGTMMRDDLPLWAPAILVYLLMPAAIIAFVLPRVSADNIFSAMAWGFTFGIVVYGVYDLTNYATLEGWTLKVSLLDMLWGGFACSVLSCIASLAHAKLS